MIKTFNMIKREERKLTPESKVKSQFHKADEILDLFSEYSQ